MEYNKRLKLSKKDIKNHLSTSKGLNSRIFITKKFHSYSDLLVKDIKESYPEMIFECKEGCITCCNLRVEALPIEAILIAKEIKKKTSDEIIDITEKLRKHTEKTKGQTFKEYDSTCPFLDQNSCTIYKIRPTKCRQYFSKSHESCVDDQMAQEFAPLKIVQHKLSDDFISLLKLKKHIMHPVELGRGVYELLVNEKLYDNWMKGQQIFELLPEKIML